MGRIDCCHKCDRPIKSPYCHNVGVCPDYTRQREKLNAENAKKLAEDARTAAETARAGAEAAVASLDIGITVVNGELCITFEEDT